MKRYQLSQADLDLLNEIRQYSAFLKGTIGPYGYGKIHKRIWQVFAEKYGFEEESAQPHPDEDPYFFAQPLNIQREKDTTQS